MSARAIILPLAILGIPGCLAPNWLYDETAGGTATAPTTTTSSSSTSSTASTSSTTASASVTATGDPTSSSTTLTTGETSTGGSSTGTTGEPADCWGRAAGDWDEIVEVLDLQLGTKPRSARLSPDGLALYYIAENEGLSRPFTAERLSRDEPFVSGALLAALPNVAGVDYPYFRRDPQDIRELILAVAFPGDLHAFVDPNFGKDIPLTALNHVDPAIQDTYASGTEDGSRLIYIRQDGPKNPHLPGATFRLYEATRAPDSPAGTPFDPPTLLPITYALPPDPQSYPPVALCSALSPDGRRLFFGSTHPVVLDSMDALDDAVGIQFAERADLASPFTPAERLDLFQLEGWETCPNAITRDGCELAFHRFIYMPPNNGTNTYRLYIARRAP